MKKQKWIFRILLYLSFIFLIAYLIKFDYLKFSHLSLNFLPLIFSLLLLWSGFFVTTLSWGYALNVHDVKIDTHLAVVSHGLSVFAKYIPGKVWVILGRAAYVSERTQNKVSNLSYISLKEQLLHILLGLLLAFAPTTLYFNREYWVMVILLTIIGLILILFVRKFHDFFNHTLSRVIKRELNLPFLEFRLSLRLSLRILIYWIAWSAGFYFFMLSVSPDIKFYHAYVFPLAVCYGVLAIFLPGGIGVREGIMVAYLTATGVDLQLAITISALSRIWFITGEVFIFLFAIILKFSLKITSQAR
jgi:glycosyltransferase 2 family protein